MTAHVTIIKKLKGPDGSWNQKQYAEIVKRKGRHLQELHSGLDDEDPDIREGCAEALGEIGFLSSVPVLIAHISDPSENVRWDVMNSLELIMGFQPGALRAWTGCSLRNRRKLKNRLEAFWRNNRDYLLKGDRGSVREKFWFNW